MELYGNGGSFFVPIIPEPRVTPESGPPTYTVPLTLNGQSGNFILDTGSLGLVASPGYYQPGSDTQLAPYATITYSTSGYNPVGALYLTNVVINGTTLNGSPASVVARVPILAAGNTGFHQLGIGFDRGGVMIGPNANSLSPANNSYNMKSVPRAGERHRRQRQHHAAGLHHRRERIPEPRPRYQPRHSAGPQ